MGRPLNKRFFNPVPDSNGEGVASVTINPADRGIYTALPTVTVGAPELPGGVTATGASTMRAQGVAVAVGGTGYQVNDVLTVVGGAGTAATFRVTQVGLLGVVEQVALTATLGSYTALATNPVATTALPALGRSGATLNVSYEVLSYAIINSGSGYVASPTFAFTGGTAGNNASATAALTTTGTNVILAHANVVDSGNVLDADIIKQTSTNEYLMNTTDGSSICTLVASDTPAEGQAYIVATDANGSTYWVTKLTAHLAVLERRSMIDSYVYQDGDDAPWSFDISGDLQGLQVQIESA